MFVPQFIVEAGSNNETPVHPLEDHLLISEEEWKSARGSKYITDKSTILY